MFCGFKCPFRKDMKLNVYSKEGDIVGNRKLPAYIFEQDVNQTLLSEVVRSYRENSRQRTASTKTRSEVRGGGRKPRRQKHTGLARAGSIRSPIWKGGGVTFGPRPGHHSLFITKKKKRLALLSSLSLLAKNGKILIIDDVSMEYPKTGLFYQMIKKLGFREHSKLLFVLYKSDDNVFMSGRNIPGVGFKNVHELNALDVLSANTVIFSMKGLTKLEERLG